MDMYEEVKRRNQPIYYNNVQADSLVVDILEEKRRHNRRQIRYVRDEFGNIHRIHKKRVTGVQAILKGVKDLIVPVMMLGLGFLALKGMMNELTKYRQSRTPEGQAGEAPTQLSGMSSGKTSAQGINDILQYEGFLPVAKDIEGKGVYTIGYGHRGKDVKPGQTITKEEAWKLFQSDLKSREDAVNKYVKVPITQNMFDALVSFVYNCGERNFRNSDTIKLLNQGKYKEAAERMKTEYINKGTIHEEGLRNRRAKESAKILSDLDTNGKIKGDVVNAPVVKKTKAGKIREVSNGTMVGGYKMINPAGKSIDLSERAETYLRNTGGQGIVTSGAEGKHAPGEISHGEGNKLDVQGLKGAGTTNKEYAELCINFLHNPETAYINLETFNINDVGFIVDYIKNHDSKAYEIANKYTPYLPGKEKAIIYGKHKVLTSLNNPGHPRHLDIGIKPNAYSITDKNSYNLENKTDNKATSGNNVKPKPKQQPKPTQNKKTTTIIPANQKKNTSGKVDTQRPKGKLK